MDALPDPALPDPALADTLAHLSDHLSGPLVGGMVLDDLRLDDRGRIAVDPSLPAGLLAVATALPTLDGSVTVALSRSQAGGEPEALPEVRFPPWSEALGFLPAGPVAPGDAIAVAASRDGAPVPAAELAALVRLRLVAGTLARLLFVMKREAPRIRREAAAIRTSRRLHHATGATLDRIGRDIAAPRFVTGADREADEAYRDRLAILRPFAAPTRAEVEARLGPGLAVVERPTGLAASMRLIAVGGSVEEARARREAWLSRLAAARLVDPVAAPAEAAFLPSAQREERRRRAARLAPLLAADDGAPRLAEPLVDGLDRVARLAATAGVALRLRLLRPPDGADPSLDFGLGIVVANPSAADRAALAPHLPAGFDPDEPSGTGLFAAAGLATRRLDAGTLLVTVRPSDLRVDGPDAVGIPDGAVVKLALKRVQGFGAAPPAAAGPVGGRPAERVSFRVGVLEGPRPRLRQQGRGATLRLRGPGLLLVVAHALVRTGGTDPFEARVVATDAALRLDLPAWERLVETLRRMRPVGIAIDTWDLRKDHVRLDDQAVDPSDVRLRRGTRPWRLPRTTAALPLSSDEGR